MNNITKKGYNFYLKHAELIGAFYCAIPVLGWILWILFTSPFRQVYIFRLVLSLGIGCPIAAYLNRYGLKIWLMKNSSKTDSANILDGIIIGSSLGISIAILPSLTSLVYTNHLEQAKWFIIISWLIAGLVGAIVGGTLAHIGKNLKN
jgi:hypothetical protein